MFNISFAELLIILLLGFLVVGPKDMKKVVIFLARSVKKGQQFLSDIKSYVNDNTKDTPITEIQETVSQIKEQINEVNPLQEINRVKNEVAEMNPLNDIQKELNPLKELKQDLQPLNNIKNSHKSNT